MSVVEQAGQVVHALRAQNRPGNDIAHQGAPLFDLDFDALKKGGFYHPEARSSQLALELRAVKRRLLRRLGFLRASGERQGFRAPGRQRNLILVTSTRAGEGKTFNALNLALSLALEDQIEVLLVDGDIPRPKIRRCLGLSTAPGVTDKIINSSLDVTALSWRARQAPLSVLPEGACVERAAELFAADASQRLWAELSAGVPDRLVIIDAPPVLATTESVILAKYVDEIVFVVEANATPEPAAASAIDELLDINPNVSLMLNRCLIGAGGSHYGSYEYYGRQEGDMTNAISPDRQMRGVSNGAA